MSTVFTFPGKMGDALHQWPVAYHWAKQTGQKFSAWMDEKTCAPLVPLFESQPCVESVKLVGGVENWNCGGQPFHLNLPTSAFDGNTIYHLGMRGFPVRQITLQTYTDAKVPVEVDPDVLANEPSLHFPDITEKKNRLVLHGQGICPHTRSTPTFWKFLSGITPELADLFDEVVFVGTEDDRETATIAYPGAVTWADDGDFLKLARFIAESKCMIGCGSSPIVLAGLLKVPAIRVHDRLGEAPKVIWNNLGENQVNDTEIGLRKEWPKFRDRWLARNPVDTAEVSV